MIEEKKKPQVEILSPAGSYESFLAAMRVRMLSMQEAPDSELVHSQTILQKRH